MQYYAHSTDSNEYQLLEDHLKGVAKLCQHYSEAFGVGNLGYLAGLLHDIGKYSEEFQQRIRGSKIRVDHSTAGAQWIMENDVIRKYLGTRKLDRHLARLIAHSIAGHHGGLKNHGTKDQEGTLVHRLSKQDIRDWSNAWKEITLETSVKKDNNTIFTKGVNKENLAWKYSFLGRMLYSCLVDADSIDTRDFCNNKAEEEGKVNEPIVLEVLLARLNKYMNNILEHADGTKINQKRREILEACERQAELSPRMFSLTVPTGGGKTLSSLSFALRHGVKYGMQRVIYVIPFTSIIEQNAQQFRDAIGQDAVLEHHSNFNYDEHEENYGFEEMRRLKLSSENWDASVIVTTSVQFFESLFSNKRSKCRKLHHISNSVIIIDEAQGIPRGYMTPCLQALQELINSYGCSVVLCTATQPSWTNLGIAVTEMMDCPTPLELLEDFKRVEVAVASKDQEVLLDETVLDWMETSDQILCIVNTRKHAKLLYEQMILRELVGVYHLSGRMCAKHRTIVIKEIKQRLVDNLPCRVVSTQLIEAGVDIDFPKVLRAMAGIDSIAQAAGRCNREGKAELGHVVVFYPENHGMPSKGWMRETAIEALNVWKYVKEDPLSLASIQNYFERIHGICDGQVEQVTDSEGIMGLIKQKTNNLEIPYVDIADKFNFIDGVTQAVVIPYDPGPDKNYYVQQLLHDLETCIYPSKILRQLQPYIVQIYQHEFVEYQKLNLLSSEAGVIYLNDTSFYHQQAGLLTANDTPITEVFIF